MTQRRSGSTIAASPRWGSNSPSVPRRTFAEAFKKDPKLAQAAINEGIALLTLQKLADAKKALQRALALDPTARRPGTTWGWLNTRATNWIRRSTSFQQAVKLDPRTRIPVLPGCLLRGDEGVRQGHRHLSRRRCRSIRCTPRRSLYWRGRCSAPVIPQRRREHFTRFQHMTSSKICSPIGLSYGEAGPLFDRPASEGPETVEKR